MSGKKLSDAKSELVKMGLKVETQYEESDKVAEEYVIRQSIQSERQVNKGDTVMIFISSRIHQKSLAHAQSAPIQNSRTQ